jgi:hypothetical protein
MGWQSQRAGKRVLACLAVLGAGGIAGLLAGFSAEPAQTSEPSPAEVVALRFPGGSRVIASNRVAAEAPSAGYALASVEPDPQVSSQQVSSLPVSSLLFSPFPTYSPAAAASASPASPFPQSPAPVAARPSLPPQLASASAEIPAQAMAYAAPDIEQPAEPAARPESPTAPAVKRVAQPPRPASPSPASPSAASPSPATQSAASASNAVLNNAQIASIRERLKLSSYQNSLWPPVETALRDISYQSHVKVASNAPASAHGATIDPNSASVQRLKSAAFPLLMSLSEEQKQEIRVMVRLMGLENLASQF